MPLETIGDKRVHIEETGVARGPLAVLIHGWSSSSFAWKPILPALGQRYRCLAVDLPGFGRSPPLNTPPSIAAYADLVAQIIELNCAGGALVLGHSMGGQVAATLAVRHPPLVEQLVLLGPVVSGTLSKRVNRLMWPHVWLERFRLVEWLLYLLSQTPIDYTDSLLKHSNFAARANIPVEDYHQIRADARRLGQGKARYHCFRAMQRGNLSSQIGQIDVPTLVVWGAEDDMVPLRDAGIIATESPTTDLRVIPNAGHWPQFEQNRITLRYISHFLGLSPEVAGEEPNFTDPDHIAEIAQFLNNSELGRKMSSAERLRLAGLLRLRAYEPGELIAEAYVEGDEMYIVKDGSIEIRLTTQAGGRRELPILLAELTAGQVAGELALLDGAKRSAEIRAGALGAHVLALTRGALATLAEDDPSIGMKMMQNLAISLGLRLRNQNWRAREAFQAEAEFGARQRMTG
jgi:pimeloyl-ACP methyl ester carboxylesterase